MRFSANLSFLFKDVPFAERFARARDAGFRAVEFMWPGSDQIGAVRRAVADTGLEVALFNFDAGNMAAGDRGLRVSPTAALGSATTFRSRSSSLTGSAARA